MNIEFREVYEDGKKRLPSCHVESNNNLLLMALFSFGPLVIDLINQYPILEVAKWLPSAQLILLSETLEQSDLWKNIVTPLVVISIWAFVAVMVAVFLFNKQKTDD
ncbi:MAG: hypothetical protein ACE3JQ_04180 [Paenisporosarcina sp.]